MKLLTIKFIHNPFFICPDQIRGFLFSRRDYLTIEEFFPGTTDGLDYEKRKCDITTIARVLVDENDIQRFRAHLDVYREYIVDLNKKFGEVCHDYWRLFKERYENQIRSFYISKRKVYEGKLEQIESDLKSWVFDGIIGEKLLNLIFNDELIEEISKRHDFPGSKIAHIIEFRNMNDEFEFKIELIIT